MNDYIKSDLLTIPQIFFFSAALASLFTNDFVITTLSLFAIVFIQVFKPKNTDRLV